MSGKPDKLVLSEQSNCELRQKKKNSPGGDSNTRSQD